MPRELPRRRSPRLSYWNYGCPGWYFLTLCCHERRCLFGEVRAGQMHLSRAGEIAHAELLRSVEIRAELTLDSMLVMPNHIHLIVVLSHGPEPQLRYFRPSGMSERRSASSFVNGYKSSVTSALKQLDLAADGEVWQRGFHDHIIRCEPALDAIRNYIAVNPLQWELDRLHPGADPRKADELDKILEVDSRIPLGH